MMRISAPIIIERRASSLTAKDLPAPDFAKTTRLAFSRLEAVENDKTIVVHIDTVENTLFLGEVGESEWEAGGDGAGVHIAADLELVGALRHGAVHSLFLLGAGDFAEDHLLTEEGF